MKPGNCLNMVPCDAFDEFRSLVGPLRHLLRILPDPWFLRHEIWSRPHRMRITFLILLGGPSSKSRCASIGNRPVISDRTASRQRAVKMPRSRIASSNARVPALTVP